MLTRHTLALLLTASLLLATYKEAHGEAISKDRLAASAQLSAADLFPGSTVAYLEFNQPAKLIDTVMDHPIRKKLESLPQYKQAMRNPKMRQARIVLAVVEASTGMDILPTLKNVSGGGIAIGFDAATRGVVITFKARDAQTLADFRDGIFDLARQDAQNKGKPDPFRATPYRGVNTYAAGQGGFAIVGPWLIFSNNAKLGHRVLDNLIDGKANTLGKSAMFQKAQAGAGINGDTMAWTWANLDAMRAMGMAKPLKQDKLQDPGQELLFGPLHQAARHAGQLIGSLQLSKTELALRLSTPMDKDKVGDRAYALGKAAEAKAAKPFLPKDTILTFSTHKDLATFWNNADVLFDENQAAKLAKSDSDLSTLFAGQSFSTEILPSLHPQMQVVLTRQSYKRDGKQPAMKLPAGAVIFKARDAKQLRTRVIVAYQSIVGFMNITAAQQNRPAMIMKTEKVDDALLLSASYVDADDEAVAGNASRAMGSMYLNYQPSIALAGDYLFIASTRDLAAELAKMAKTHKDEPSKSNTAFTLNVAPGLAALKDNYKQLVAQNMLKEGHTMAEAEGQISLILDLLTMLKGMNADFTVNKGFATMELGVQLAE